MIVIPIATDSRFLEILRKKAAENTVTQVEQLHNNEEAKSR